MVVPLVLKVVIFSLTKKAVVFLVAKLYGFPRLYRRASQFNNYVNRDNPVRREKFQSRLQFLFRLPTHIYEKVQHWRGVQPPQGPPSSSAAGSSQAGTTSSSHLQQKQVRKIHTRSGVAGRVVSSLNVPNPSSSLSGLGALSQSMKSHLLGLRGGPSRARPFSGSCTTLPFGVSSLISPKAAGFSPMERHDLPLQDSHSGSSVPSEIHDCLESSSSRSVSGTSDESQIFNPSSVGLSLILQLRSEREEIMISTIQMETRTVAGNTALDLCSVTFKVTLFRTKETHQVLFLEAGKDFVDTLFGFLVMPLGTVLHALSKGVQVKPLNGISGIFESVDASFLRVDAETLAQPRLAAPAGCPCLPDYGDLKLQCALEAAKISQFPETRLVLKSEDYKCSNIRCTNLSILKNGECESCRSYHDYSLGPYSAQEEDPNKVSNSPSDSGFVKESITFIITDNMEIMPSNTTASMSLLSKCVVASLSNLERKEITVEITQILQLLHSALTSSTCLNDVFGQAKK